MDAENYRKSAMASILLHNFCVSWFQPTLSAKKDSHDLTLQLAIVTREPLAHPSPSPAAGWGGEMDLREEHNWTH